MITLYSIDIGYSIKLSIAKEEPLMESYFNYADDTILKYVEKEQLPPHLLDLLDRVEPRIFYCGCIIAEIHDLIGVPRKLSRILLRPFSLVCYLNFLYLHICLLCQMIYFYLIKLFYFLVHTK